MVFADVYLQPDAPDPVLDEQLVCEVVRRHAPDAGGLLAIDESGGEARAYLLDGDIVLKTQRPHRLRPRTSLAKEAFVLGELHRQAAFPVPRVLGHGYVGGSGRGGGSDEYLCLTRIPGAPLAHATVEPEDRRRVLEELGRTLRSIHGVDQSVLEHNEHLPGDRTPGDLRARIAGTFTRLATAFEADTRLAAIVDVPRIAAQRLETVPDDTPPVSLHSNPGPEHTFVQPSSGAFTGLIDFGDAYRSHPAFDFRQWGADDDAAAVLDGYRSAGALPPHFEEVRCTVLVLEALGRAARGKSTPEQLAAALRRLTGPPGHPTATTAPRR